MIDAVLAAHPDAIIHQATALGGEIDFKHFDRSFHQTNLVRAQGTDSLLAAPRAAGVKRFVTQNPRSRAITRGPVERFEGGRYSARWLQAGRNWRGTGGARVRLCAHGALSDGVFAIALTLLALAISAPTLAAGHHGELARRLLDRQQEFRSYAISFAVIAFLWVRHHTFFRGLDRIDTQTTVLNLTHLGLVAFLPYPTRILGLYRLMGD